MWTAQLHGDTSDLSDTDARDEEMHLATVLRDIVAEFVPRGHTGVLATFSGDHVGAVNLTDPAEAPTGTPEPGLGELADGTARPAPDAPPPTFPVEP